MNATPPAPASPTRRRFLQSGAFAAGVTALPSLGVVGAGGRIRVGLIGPGGMGTQHLKQLASSAEVELGWVCDVDSRRLEVAAGMVRELGGGRAPQATADMRRVFDDPAVDAVFIATPDHWHAPATLLALEAGKHVYVEKPCSHTLREGRRMVEAARKAGRVVQVGTQSRSAAHVLRAMELLKGGAIGEVLAAKAWNSQFRGGIGHAPPSDPPPELDFDTWTGPAPRVPYRANLLPGKWRWFHAFGAGDMGNDGVHDLDIARWGLGVEAHPSRIAALGGKYFHEDDQQWPDTQYVVFEYEVGRGRRKMLTYEQRLWSDYHQEGFENGDAFYGTEGYLILGKSGGWKLFDRKDRLREEMTGRPDLAAHHRDFFDCLRRGGRPRADILEGHLSAGLCHLGNIATRLGRTLRFDGKAERVVDDAEADAMLAPRYREHWGRPRTA